MSETRRNAVLERAGELISGDRQTDYGDALTNFTKIADGWALILGVDKISPHQVALCMDWVKTARLLVSPNHTDSWIDKAGYAALGAELQSRE